MLANVCHLCGVDTSCRQGMSPLMHTTFLCGPALAYFTDAVLNNPTASEDALKCLEDHFSDNRAKRVNDGVWLNLTLELGKAKRSLKIEDVTHERSCMSYPHRYLDWLISEQDLEARRM